jgi:hypothetical protein
MKVVVVVAIIMYSTNLNTSQLLFIIKKTWIQTKDTSVADLSSVKQW